MKDAFKHFRHQAFQREVSKANGRQAIEQFQKKLKIEKAQSDAK